MLFLVSIGYWIVNKHSCEIILFIKNGCLVNHCNLSSSHSVLHTFILTQHFVDIVRFPTILNQFPFDQLFMEP